MAPRTVRTRYYYIMTSIFHSLSLLNSFLCSSLDLSFYFLPSGFFLFLLHIMQGEDRPEHADTMNKANRMSERDHCPLFSPS